VLFGPYVEELAIVFRPVIEKASLEVSRLNSQGCFDRFYCQFRISYDAEETRALFIDPDYMEKIIFNLIGNAFKCGFPAFAYATF